MLKRVVGTIVTAVLAGSALAAPSPHPNPVILIYSSVLLDKPGAAPRGASTITVVGGKIVELRDGYAPAPPGARVIDLRDQFVLPGMIDMHVHLFSEGDPLKSRLEGQTRDLEDNILIAARNSRVTLEAGFTTVRDLGSEPRAIASLRDAILEGHVPGPTIVPAGAMISVSGGHGDANGLNRDASEAMRRHATHLCDGPDSCRRAVRMQISQGAEVIKFAASGGVNSNVAAGLGRQMFEDEMAAIVATAHMFGRRVTAHAHGKSGIDAALRAGVDSVEHGTFADDETVALFKRRGAYLVPTELAASTVLEQASRGDRPPATLAKAEAAAKAARENHKRAIMAGVKIAFGTDSGVSKHGDNAREFALLVAGGMTPMGAIEAATVNAAELLGRSDNIGTIEIGKDADIIAVQGNPMDDVAALGRVAFVMRRGIVSKLAGARQAFPPN